MLSPKNRIYRCRNSVSVLDKLRQGQYFIFISFRIFRPTNISNQRPL